MSCPVLSGSGGLGLGGVAGGDVEHAVGAEVQVAAVVPALQEGEDDLLARRVDPRRVRLGDREPRHPRAVRQVRLARLRALQGVADEALAVLLEVRVERQPVDRLDLLRLREQVDRLEFLAQVEEEVGLGVRLVGERVQHAGLLADEEPVAPRTAGDEQGMLELQVRERPHHLEGRRRVGRADDAGGRPGRANRTGRARPAENRAAPESRRRAGAARPARSGTGGDRPGQGDGMSSTPKEERESIETSRHLL